VVTETDLELSDGNTLHVYDTGADDADGRLAVFWHHGTPNIGPWGFDPAQVMAPVLLVHGGRDRVVPSSHSEWLARCCPSAELRLCPEDGHISVLTCSVAAMERLREHVEGG
jgi:pimeloyl-ACP methyl ester carboxylesterase